MANIPLMGVSAASRARRLERRVASHTRQQQPGSAPSSGFTLLETLVAMLILGVMAAVSFPRMGTWYASLQARQAAGQMLTQLRQLPATAVHLHQSFGLAQAAAPGTLQSAALGSVQVVPTGSAQNALAPRYRLQLPTGWRLDSGGDIVFLPSGLCVPGLARFSMGPPEGVEATGTEVTGAAANARQPAAAVLTLQVASSLCEMRWLW